jgi:hypothetical protein
MRHISRGVNNPNHLQRLFLRIVDNPVISMRLRQPKPQRQVRQVLANTTRKRILRQECAALIDRRLDAIRRIHIVGCVVSSDFDQVFDSLRCELITAHAWRFSASQARFLSSIFERT